jgi:uncharacterized protein
MPFEPLSAARPELLIDGKSQSGLTAGLLAMFIEESVDALSRCELTVNNWGTSDTGIDFLYFDRKLIDFGKKISVVTGSGDSRATIFDGHISGIEARFFQKDRQAELTVLAEDRLQDLRMTRRTRSFETMTDSDIFRAIASDHGLQISIDLTIDAQRRIIAQVNQSDLAFLFEHAQTIDAQIWAEGDNLYVQSRCKRNKGESS